MKWSKRSATLRLNWKNSFSEDLTVIVEAVFVRPNGSTFGAAAAEENADEGKSTSLPFKFKAEIAEAASVRFKIHTAPE